MTTTMTTMMTTMTMKIEAYAKINLTLEVFAQRVDGFHALRSIVMPVSLADSIEIEPADSIASDSPYADDLCVKAAQRLAARLGRAAGAYIRISKRIPAGGGLGGGSADAAATLCALNEMWHGGLDVGELCAVGAEVGSDVPALVLSRTAGAVLMEGRGEVVSPLASEPLPRYHVVLVNPGVFSATGEVFAAVNSRVTNDPSILYNMRQALAAGDAQAVAELTVNDLQAPAVRLHPEIADAIAALHEAGAYRPAMSGSGSTVFGFVPDETRGREIAAFLSARGWWARAAYCCPVM